MNLYTRVALAYKLFKINMLCLDFASPLSYSHLEGDSEMHNSLKATKDALESIQPVDWISAVYHNRNGIKCVITQFRYAGQHHRIGIHNCRSLPCATPLLHSWSIRMSTRRLFRRPYGIATSPQRWGCIPALQIRSG